MYVALALGHAVNYLSRKALLKSHQQFCISESAKWNKIKRI